MDKRKTVHFTKTQKLILEKYYSKSPYVSNADLDQLSQELNASKQKLFDWFRHRINKTRKYSKEYEMILNGYFEIIHIQLQKNYMIWQYYATQIVK